MAVRKFKPVTASPIVEDNGGCGSNIGGNTVVLFIAITAVAAIIIVRKVLRKN